MEDHSRIKRAFMQGYHDGWTSMIGPGIILTLAAFVFGWLACYCSR